MQPEHPDEGQAPGQYQPPGYQQPGYQDPQFQQPGDQQPGYPPPGYQQPGYAPPPAQDPFAAPAPIAPDAYQPYGYPAAQPYAAPGYPTATNTKDNAFGVVALILGILSIPLACCFGGGGLFGIGAIVLGALGMRRASAGTANNRGLAIAGLSCGAVGLVLAVGFWVIQIAVPSLNNYTN